ncbi:MAG: HAD family hydrolase [Eubacteriales bacterium]|nr:HAD family hydrolase [Eubacteriales bacterium]
MIRLIITDVDDTLVPESCSVINPEYYDIIRECRKKGIFFGVASGRQKPCVKNLFRPVLDEIFILADNGTDIWAKDYTISMKIPNEDYQGLAREYYELGDEYNIMSCKPDIAYIENGHEEYYEHMRSYPYELEYVENAADLTDICKVSIWRREGIEQDVEERMRRSWSDRMEVCLGGECFLDFMNKGCNKGKALSIIQEHYGIKPEETAAFGNADNDIPMLRQAKYSYAVAGASDNLKAVASEVIGEMKDDAVLKKIREILDEQK